ncbi:MAG TPA: DEAD/DEAH box helicase [Terriglobia bacterium]|nr:DEAD/DEAH box helicase [Terriglobia bacterium]
MSINAPPCFSSLAWAHELLQEWFAARFSSPSEPQEQGWPHILAGKATLISAPTGSGKTLAAFLACIDRLIRKALSGELQDRTEVLYVSPLKALSNDIHKNLEVPLGEITELAGRRGLLMPPIRAAVRTGDTLMPQRRAMIVRPPHILVTTPESLYLLLTAEKSRAILKNIETVILDEIHAVADDKRGAHLALSLERLEHLVGQSHPNRPPVRIGLSATQEPIDLVARFLAGDGRPEPAIVDLGHRRALDVGVEVPGSELGPVASNEMWDEIYERLAELIRAHRTTLVFVNTRRLSERVAHHLGERLGVDAVAAHHGSLSRKLRLEAENRLKSGEVRVLVATASLELGIDIGAVDLVCQIESPRSLATALQRIGRAGHWRGAVPKGRFFAMTRDELIECAALVKGIREGQLDRLHIPQAPLDILAQQIVAMCACEDWNEDDLFDAVRRAYPYRELPRSDFDAVVEVLSEGIAARRGRYGAYLHRDRVQHRLRGRRGSRLVAIMNGGAIPETALYQVVAEPDGAVVGTIDEDFAVESMRGDIFLLGNSSWRTRRLETYSGRVLVEDAHGAPPNVPFWRGEAPARTAELSAQVSEIRQTISDLTVETGSSNARKTTEQSNDRPPDKTNDFPPALGKNAAVSWLKEHCGLDDAGAEQATDYVLAGKASLGAVPTQNTVVAERFFDEAGGMQLVIHAPFGGRINRAWGLALRKRFCRSFNFELQAAATEDGLNISLGEQHSFPLGDVFQFVTPHSARSVLEQATLASPIFGTRWRWDATRALALTRFRSGKKIPLQVQRMRADDLLAAVFPDAAACQDNIQGDIHIPDHPLVREVMKDVLTEALDLEGLQRVLGRITDGSIRTVAVDTPTPSPFSHEILNANPYAYLDDAPLEERRARAVSLRRTLPESVLGEIGHLDPAAIAQVREEAWPDVRDADELSEALQVLVALPEDFTSPGGTSVVLQWGDLFRELLNNSRVARARVGDTTFWVAAERAKTFAVLFPSAEFEKRLAEVEETASTREEASLKLARGWLAHSGPIQIPWLAATLHLPETDIEAALFRLEAEGTVLRAQFTNSTTTEWCERRLLARIHRLTLGELRKAIRPVTAVQFMRWLHRWQHMAPGTQVLGEHGLFEVVRQLQGFEAPANAWERHILARRVSGYNPQALDRLCLTGAVGWGRVSPHPATFEAIAGPVAEAQHESPRSTARRRVVPSSVAPITLFVREDSDWMIPRTASVAESLALSHIAGTVLEFIRQRGASFFTDMVRGTGTLKSEVETALWELVTAGLVTADGFDNLRALIDRKRRAGQRTGRSARPRHSSGRWSLLFSEESADRLKAIETACRVLLERYGVVFRELIVRESFPFKWRELLVAFRRLEDRGEVRGGRFVDGFLGEQFGLPVAVESLRATRGSEPKGETVTIAAADPLNLIRILVPGDRVPAISGTLITLRDGVPTIDQSHLPTAVGYRADNLSWNPRLLQSTRSA